MDLMFKDFIKDCSEIVNNEKKWIYLYKSDVNKDDKCKDDIFIMSAMIENKTSLKEKLKNIADWGFANDSFGKSTFYQYGNIDGDIEFSSGRLVRNRGIEFEYTVAIRHFNGDFKPAVEINPELIWYGNLIKTENEYIDEVTKEIKLKYEDNEVKIQRDYLKDYLAAKNKICMIAFDNRRFTNSQEDSTQDYVNVNKENLSYHLNIGADNFDDYKLYSSIIGKVFIEPYTTPLHEHYRYFFPDKEEYQEFIISVDETNGNPILNTCDENKLSNFFGGNIGEPHFLTPVFFSKDVLDRYTNNPEQYSVNDDSIMHLNIWSLPFTVNKNRTISVWLGDLGKIPYKEQVYWSVFNINPKGQMNEDFIDRQLNCVWNESIRIEKKMFELIDKVNKVVEEKYDGLLFNKLNEGDKQLRSAFILPSNNGITQFQNFLMQLNKLTVERINTKLIGKHVKKGKLLNSKGERLGSRIQLYEFTKQIGLSNSDELDTILKLITNCRNKLAGHSASIPQYNKLWLRKEDEKINTGEDAEYLLTQLNNNLEVIINEVGD